MARPKLIKGKNNLWYRILDGKQTKLNPGYKYYNLTSKSWLELGKDNKFHDLKVGVRTSGLVPSRKLLTKLYMKHDLAPKLYPNPHLTNWGDHNNKHYKEVNDSIIKRINSGYYKKYPELYKRDIEMRDLYNTDYGSGATCINSASCVSGTNTPGNYTFYEKTPKRFNKPVTIDSSSLSREISKGIPAGSIIQLGGDMPHHSVAYYGENPENKNEMIVYDTRGSDSPFWNGSQLRTLPKNYYDFFREALNIYRLNQ